MENRSESLLERLCVHWVHFCFLAPDPGAPVGEVRARSTKLSEATISSGDLEVLSGPAAGDQDGTAMGFVASVGGRYLLTSSAFFYLAREEGRRPGTAT